MTVHECSMRSHCLCWWWVLFVHGFEGTTQGVVVFFVCENTRPTSQECRRLHAELAQKHLGTHNAGNTSADAAAMSVLGARFSSLGTCLESPNQQLPEAHASL